MAGAEQFDYEIDEPERGRRRWAGLNLPEVKEKDASGDVAEIYQSTKETLRASVVNLVWRVFATKPKFLSSLWEELQPAVDEGLMQGAEALRAAAIQRVREAGTVPDHRPLLGGDLSRAMEQLRVFLEVNPRLLILLCALERAWRGQEVGGHREAVSPRRGVPEWHPEIEAHAPAKVANTFDDMVAMLDLPAPNTDYQMLAGWPEYLNQAWSELRTFVPMDSWRDICRMVEATGDQIAVALPSTVRLSKERAGQYGLEADEAEEVGRWIEAFHDILPGLIVNTSWFWIGMHGGTDRLPTPAQGAESPLPAHGSATAEHAMPGEGEARAGDVEEHPSGG